MIKGISSDKRDIIRKANRTMFMIVAGCSVVVGACLVSAILLIRRGAFNQKIINEQNVTIQNLDANAENLKKVEQEVSVLKTNEELLSKKIYPKQTALQVVLDALPDRANSPALGESIKRSILNVPGLEIEQMVVIKTDEETSDKFAGQSISSYNEEYDDISEPSINFRFKVLGTELALNQVLRNVENSIRPIYIDKFDVQSSGREFDDNGKRITDANRKHSMTVYARSFYSKKVEPKMNNKTMKEK